MRKVSKSLVFPAIMVAFLATTLVAGPVIGSAQQFTDQFTLPGVINPTGCRVGAVMSTDQFTTTGFSNVRISGPNHEAVAGAWVVSDNWVGDTGVVQAPNCTPDVNSQDDNKALNILGIRLKPTITSAGNADIQQVRLFEDVNLNGQFDPLIDIQLGQLPGSALDSQDGAVFHYGPQQPIRTLGDPQGTCNIQTTNNNPTQSTSAQVQLGTIFRHTQVQNQTAQAPCAAGFLAIVDVGDQPKTGSQFGLEMEVLAGDIPSPSFGQNAADFSSGISSSQNPQASNVRLMILGGTASSETPITHISNGSGSPETAARVVHFTGGQAGEGLLTRFRQQQIQPGTREAIAIAFGLCDGGELANTNASILPSIANAAPRVAGGLASLPCISSGGTDTFATGINGATLIFDGPNAEHMGTVRMYVDGDQDGTLFEPGELTQQVTPVFNEETGEAIAVFGGQQGQILYTGNGNPVAAGTDGGPAPLLIVFTVDVDDNATNGQVDVKAGLQSFDDTAQRNSVPGRQPCAALPAGVCGSNFMNEAPGTTSFQIEGADSGGGQPSGVAQYDTNNSGVIDDNEFMAAIDDWIAGSIGDALFFDVLDAWVDQTSVSSASLSGLSLNGVSLSSSSNGTTFAVSGQGIEGTSVEVFSLDGSTVFNRETAGSTLTWNHTAGSGASVANGVYLYRVTVEGADGSTVTSRVQKLVVVR